MSLAGTWTFTPSGAAATTITVPGGGWVAQGFRSVNQARYQRMATVPDLGRAQATYLEFGAINHEATLTVDSTMVGTQTTSFTPSVFDVTSAVKPGMSHSFTVDVKGRNALKGSSGKKLVPDAAGWSGNVPQGIFRSAVLHVVPALHVFETLVRTDVAADQFSIDVWVKNDGAVDRHRHRRRRPVELDLRRHDVSDGPLEARLRRRGQDRQGHAGPGDLGAGRQLVLVAERPVRAGLPGQAARRARDGHAGRGRWRRRCRALVPVRFGFRQSRQVAAHYELNGVPIKFRGDNIQGADYDSIKNTGMKDNSDAYDLFPGFLPPSANNPGWPQAVDNWQRLNYNVARLHQEPVSPYMLDVMDEMGMMVIDESRHPRQQQRPGLHGRLRQHDRPPERARAPRPEPPLRHPLEPVQRARERQHELQRVRAAALSDGDGGRRHPAGQRGRRARRGRTSSTATAITANNFAAFEHYPSGFGTYTHDVAVSTTHPYGDGEFIWAADNTAQGLMWFATSTVTLRQKDPSDIRPYTLLSSWASFVPGVKANMMTIEQGGPPLYNEDNLPMPWSNPIIMRVQRAFNPVAVIDTAYWETNHMSDKSGAWPISKPAVTKGAQVTPAADGVQRHPVGHGRGRLVGDAPGQRRPARCPDMGSMHLDVPLAGHANVTATVTAPAAGTTAVLVLKSSKNGTVVFQDDGELFTLQ